MRFITVMFMLLCGGSLYFVPSNTEAVHERTLNDREVERTLNSQKDEHSLVQKRDLIQFSRMIECSTGRSAFYYSYYGNWCGLGGRGRPVDDVDRCCRTHDRCYKRYESWWCNPKWLSYSVRVRKRNSRCVITCKTILTYTCLPLGRGWSYCKKVEKQVCKCDRAAAKCFAKYHYNKKYFLL